MNKNILSFVLLFLVSFSVFAASERTLRVDYILSGDANSVSIALDGLYSLDYWAGRNVNVDSVPVRGNGMIMMKDESSGRILWKQSFSTLFQEWQATEEAVRVRKSFEAVYNLPMPEQKALVRIELYDARGEICASLEHIVDPADILIRHIGADPAPHRYILKSGDIRDCIDVAVVAEGYTAAERDLFYEDAAKVVEGILSEEPFASCRDRFNFVAVALESKDSGVSEPAKGIWKNTPLSSHFSTFYSDRYLTTSSIRQLNNSLAGIPFEHVIILANTDTYGGGGIYNSYTLTTVHHPVFRKVVTHEFGHSFAGLGDEYFYDAPYSDMYFSDIEPWEQNLTTLKDFSAKWKDSVSGTWDIDDDELWSRIAAGEDERKFIGVYEGGGYVSKGVYRPFPDCLMKTTKAPFCPVCKDAITRMILFQTEELKR